MLKTILIVLLGVYFILNGLNHLFNRKILEEYAAKRQLFEPKWAVLLSGFLLISGGTALMIREVRVVGVYGLCVFLLMATFMIHRFWSERDPNDRMLEGMNFTKNLAIAVELLYVGFYS